MWKISRYWNRVVYAIADVAHFLIWDQTGRNADILADDFYSNYTREIMTSIPKKRGST